VRITAEAMQVQGLVARLHRHRVLWAGGSWLSAGVARSAGRGLAGPDAGPVAARVTMCRAPRSGDRSCALRSWRRARVRAARGLVDRFALEWLAPWRRRRVRPGGRLVPARRRASGARGGSGGAPSQSERR